MALNKAILLLISVSSLHVLSSDATAVSPPETGQESPSSSSNPDWSALVDMTSLCRLTPNPDVCEKIGIQGGNSDEALIFADFSADAVHNILGSAEPEKTLVNICNKTAHLSTCMLWYYVAVDADAASSGNKSDPIPPADVTIAKVLEMEIRATKDLARGLGAELTYLHNTAANPQQAGVIAGEMSAEYGRFGELFGQAASGMEAAEEGLRGNDMMKVKEGIRSALAHNKQCKDEVAHGVAQVHMEAQFSSLGQSEATGLSVLSQSLVKMIRYTTKIDVLGGICMTLAINIDA